MGSIKGRAPTQLETDLLTALLEHEFEGVAELRTQASNLVVSRGCSCGCGTVDLIPQGDSAPAAGSRSPVPCEGTVLDDRGDAIGGLLLFLREGLLSSLEIYSYDEPLPLPNLDRVVWHTT